MATARYQGRLYAVPFTSNAGLLYYRKDILAKAGRQPPTTWAQLASLARTVAPRYGLGGYAGQFVYEGLTVNFAEAVQSAGGSILSPDDPVTLDYPGLAPDSASWSKGCAGLDTASRAQLRRRGIAEGVRGGQAVVPAQLALCLWPGQQARPRVTRWRASSASPHCPGPDGPGSSSLGGANLAISAFSRHQLTALAFIRFLTSMPVQRQILISASLPPVWTRLYDDRALIARFPYLPVLKKAILDARPRPQIASYNQLSLAVSSTVHQALMQKNSVNATISELSNELNQIVRNG